jgi:uncharacterized protein
MNIKTREFQIFAKPVGALCNLNCTYCYYLSKKELYKESSYSLMSSELLERYIIQQIEATTEEIIMFSWHGGEPTLAGIEFYRKAVAIQKQHLPPAKKLVNGIQTNGTLLNESWCRFLAEENFMVGISLDGPEELHNIHRKNSQNDNSFSKVISGYINLQKFGITPEILCVVNAHNVLHPLRIYNFFKELGAKYITFLPLVERQHGTLSGVTTDSVPADAFSRFLITVFNEWVEKDIGKVQIQIFEEAIRTAFDQGHTLCVFKVNCGGVPVLEHNGDFYVCDHFVDSNHLLGNINDRSLAYFLDCPEQKAFGEAKSNTLPRYCKECQVLDMCNGECPKNRFIETPDGEPGLNYLCEGYKAFFIHIKPFVEAVKQVSN